MPKKLEHKDHEKLVDLPPKGSRNPDPITDAAGAHPIETGIGAALGGAAAGMAVGAVGGPIGAVIGGIVGGAAVGGLAGKGVGELIDPTTEDTWLSEYYDSKRRRSPDKTKESYRDAYHYGISLPQQYSGKSFEDIETEARTGWNKVRGKGLTWTQARGAVRHAFDRTIKLHEEKLNVEKTPVETGNVKVRKEVHTEHKTLDVPVQREEVVIERRPTSGTAAGDIKAEEIRIPVKEEQVRVHKEPVVKEEVTVRKQTVHDTKQVAADVKREDVVVENEGKAKVRHTHKEA